MYLSSLVAAHPALFARDLGVVALIGNELRFYPYHIAKNGDQVLDHTDYTREVLPGNDADKIPVTELVRLAHRFYNLNELTWQLDRSSIGDDPDKLYEFVKHNTEMRLGDVAREAWMDLNPGRTDTLKNRLAEGWMNAEGFYLEEAGETETLEAIIKAASEQDVVTVKEVAAYIRAHAPVVSSVTLRQLEAVYAQEVKA